MKTFYAGSSLELRNALDIGLPGDRYVVRDCVLEDVLDSYEQRIQGGLTWGTRTVIEARGSVVLRPTAATGGQMALRLAHAINKNLEVIGLEIDAANMTHHALKVTDSGAGAANQTASDVQFTRCAFRNAHYSGAMITAPRVRFIGGSAYRNGTTSNLDHGLYIQGDDCRISQFDAYENAAFGIHIYSGGGPNRNGRIEYSRAWGNGTISPYGAGFLLASGNHTAYRCAAWGNPVGFSVYKDANGVVLRGNVTAQAQGTPIEIWPGAVGTVNDTQLI